MKAGKSDPSQNSDKGQRTDDIVSEKLGIGSRDTYRKEKYIVDNQESLSPEDFADWDEGRLSTNKAFKKIKEEKELLEKRIKEFEIDQQSLQNYEQLTELVPELQDWVETGIVRGDTLR